MSATSFPLHFPGTPVTPPPDAKPDYARFKPRAVIYKGCRFRSTLESHWAAFFDALGFDWLYEPVELGGWAPDFLIRTTSTPLYVEVKPTETVNEDAADKMRRVHAAPCLMLGLGPFRYGWAEAAIGWWISRQDHVETIRAGRRTHPHPAALMRFHRADPHVPQPWGIGCLINGYRDRISGEIGNPFTDAVLHSEVHRVWNEAGNAVQRTYP